MKWKEKLIKYLIEELQNDNAWSSTIEKVISSNGIGIHLAIFNEPFLSLVFKGEKKIESRFSINKVSPYGKVLKGDIILAKESGGPIVGIFLAGEIKYYDNLNSLKLREIENKFGNLIGSHYDTRFWKNRSKSRYATLIDIKKIRRLGPFLIGKNDRTGWSVVRLGLSQTLFKQDS